MRKRGAKGGVDSFVDLMMPPISFPQEDGSPVVPEEETVEEIVEVVEVAEAVEPIEPKEESPAVELLDEDDDEDDSFDKGSRVYTTINLKAFNLLLGMGISPEEIFKGYRECRRCGHVKVNSLFGKGTGQGGLHSYCKVCVSKSVLKSKKKKVNMEITY